MFVPLTILKRLAPGLLMLLLGGHSVLYAGHEVLGEIQLVGASKVEKTSGVWIDGQYLGYVKELKGSKKILLMPGEHEITVRQAGYLEFSRKVVAEPGQKQVIEIVMQKDPTADYSTATAEVKIAVKPNRAAVFVDNRYVGHVDEFDGPGQALLLAPGERQFKITLPGYLTFETTIRLRDKQKFELKTELFKGSITEAGSLIKEDAAEKNK